MSELDDVPSAYFIPVKLGNLNITALLDTGSGCDIISEETARKASLPIQPNFRPLLSVDQSPLSFLGTVNTLVKISNIKVPTQAYVKNYVQNLLLGRKTMEEVKVQIDCGNNKIRIGCNTYDTRWYSCDNVALVRTICPVHIQPNSATLVQLTIGCKDSEGLVEGKFPEEFPSLQLLPLFTKTMGHHLQACYEYVVRENHYSGNCHRRKLLTCF